MELNDMQIAMLVFLCLFGACSTINLLTMRRRKLGNKTKADYLIMTCSNACVILAGMLGILTT